jgi:preprotein translocase subunit SecE
MAKETPDQGKEAKKNNKEQVGKNAQKKPANKQVKSDKDQKKPAKGTKQAPKKDSIFKKIATYFRNVRMEIKRTTWPTRNEVLRMSLIVVGALLFFGVFIFLIDWAMTQLVELYSGLAPQPDPSALPVDGTTTDPSSTADTSGSGSTEQ